MRHRSRFAPSALLLTGALLAACSDSNEPPAEDHTPVRLELAVNGVAMADDTVRLTAGGSDTVRVTFYNVGDENLDVAEDEHYSTLTFLPATGLASTLDTIHHFRHEVVNTVAAGTPGNLDIGYGHDAAADEYSFTVAYKVE
jgi:hypothetical protein